MRLAVPTGNEAVLNVATPPESVADPSSAAPLKKFTVPGGVPAADVTVAVSVTL